MTKQELIERVRVVYSSTPGLIDIIVMYIEAAYALGVSDGLLQAIEDCDENMRERAREREIDNRVGQEKGRLITG